MKLSTSNAFPSICLVAVPRVEAQRNVLHHDHAAPGQVLSSRFLFWASVAPHTGHVRTGIADDLQKSASKAKGALRALSSSIQLNPYVI